MKKLFTWLDNNILLLFSFFLLFFIPLYPKLPLFELIPGYIVRVRLEDFFILTAFLIFLIQVIRKKATFKSVIFWPIVIYLTIGFLSIPSAVFISKTIPLDRLHILKALLHWLRRIEYFSIFFIFYNGLTRIKDIKRLTIFSLVILTLLSLYGYGQKYLYWPVYSTMNREFSKGMRLYLTEHARVPSTFGGHYDLAAFLVIFLILFAGFFLLLKAKILKGLFFVVFILSYWLLILTASRTSFIAYLVGITILCLIFAFKRGFFWVLPRWSGLIIFSFLIMIFFGDLSDRFAHFLKMPEIKEKLKLDTLLKPLRPAPKEALKITDEIALVMDVTDERPVAKKPSLPGEASGPAGLPPDVFEDIPDWREATGAAAATLSAGLEATMAGRFLVRVSRTFSENAYKYGLSTAIRLDALWPWAIAGFKRNPLLGSGYSTLSKAAVEQFTEAESTDNDYLRALGETGLLGFLSFFAIIFIIIKTAVKALKPKLDPFIFAFIAGFIAFTVGLLINALYIDVFEASKVAFTFWALAGVLLALIPQLAKTKREKAAK
jgi:hypothetical protein